MTIHHNSAWRLNEILQKAAKCPDNTPTKDVWAQTLGVTADSEAKKLAEVSASLALLHSEVELLRSQMAATTFSALLYEPYLRKVESAISTHALSSGWNNFKQYLTPDVTLALRYCLEILPDEEDPISEDEYKSLMEEVDALEDALASTTLPESVKGLILRHLGLIRKALRDYGVVGIKAVKEAVHRAAGELVEYKEVIRENQGAEEISHFGRIWQRTTQMADGVLKADRVLQAGGKVWELVKPIFDSSSSC